MKKVYQEIQRYIEVVNTKMQKIIKNPETWEIMD